MKRKLKQRWSTIPAISTKGTITSYFNALNTKKNHDIWHCKSSYWFLMKFICMSFRNRQKSEPLKRFSALFRSECKLIWYLLLMYIYLCLSCNVNNSNTELPNCLKRVETIVVLIEVIVFSGVIYDVHAYTVTVFYRSSLMNQVPEKIYYVHD